MLLESLMAISLITLIMGGLASFTITALTTTSEQRTRQAAAQVATTAMAALRGIPATDLVTGRDATSVAAQFSAAPAKVQPALTAMTQVSDSTAAVGAGATAAIPTSPVTQILNNTTYSVSTYLGTCVRPVASSSACVAVGAGITNIRAVVAVTWRHTNCPSDRCTYVSSTLVNQDADPVFNTNKAEPPVAPDVDGPGNQLNTRGATVAVQFEVEEGTGVGNNTWQITSGTLPTGLTLSASGLVSGIPTVNITATPLTVTVTDAFGRTGSATFNWTIVGPPTINNIAAQTSVQAKPITNVTPVSTCPNTPCTFSMANAPAGVTINATTGVISGTPTTAATYSGVTVTIRDEDNVTATTAGFTWVVNPAPTITWPGNLNATIGADKSVPISYTCPTATCTIALLGTTIPGLGLSATTPNTTNNTTLSRVVNGPSGTIYIAGRVQATAVPTGTSKAFAPQLRITDGNATQTNSATGAWTAFVKATIASPGTRSVTETGNQSVGIAYTCPNQPCTITLANTVPGLGLSTTAGSTGTNTTTSIVVTATSGTIYIKGLVGPTAVTTGNSKTYAVGLTISDADAMTATASATWTAYVAPTVNHPGSQAAEPNQNVSLQMTAACPNGGCTWVADVQVGNDPDWISFPISGTGLITYPSAPAGSYQIRVRVTDAAGATETTTFPLTVQTFSLNVPNQFSTRPASGTKIVTFDVAALVNPQVSGYTYVLTGRPSWLTINANGLMTATLTPTSTTDTSITLTVTSKASSTSNVADTFSWTIS